MARLHRESVAFAASVRKELWVMRRYPANVVTTLVVAIVVPAAYLAQASGFAGGNQSAVDAFAGRSGTTQVAGFIYLGWAVYLWISLIMWGPGMALRQERVQGALEQVFLTPVSRFTVLFGPATAQLVPALLLFTVVGVMLRFAFHIPIGFVELRDGLILVAASVPVLFAIGAAFAIAVLRFRDAAGIASAVQGIMALICGVTYPIAVLPDWLQPVSRALPPTQVLDGLRTAVLQPQVSQDIGVRALTLLAAGVVVGGTALLTLRRVLRTAERSGRLAQF